MSPTTNIQVTREQAAVLLGAVRAQLVLAREFPGMYQDTEALRLTNVETLVECSLDRLNWIEQYRTDPDIRARLAARTAYPNEAA